MKNINGSFSLTSEHNSYDLQLKSIEKNNKKFFSINLTHNLPIKMNFYTEKTLDEIKVKVYEIIVIQ